MRKQGKFLLFDNVAEFGVWLSGQAISRSIKLIQNHHTWMPDYTTFKGNNHFALLQSMENSHIQRGFDGIGQNLTTFPDGTLAVCRAMDKIPAGIKGANTGGVCMEHVGNFDVGKDQMRQEHRNGIIGLNAALCHKFALTPSLDTIVYHHWYDLDTGKRTNGTGNTKTCPGTAFFGGNTTEAAAANFIPLVVAALTGVAVPAPPTVLSLGSYTVNAPALNVRTGPAATQKLLKQLTKGILVDAFEANGDWLRVHSTEQHWVNKRFVTAVATG